VPGFVDACIDTLRHSPLATSSEISRGIPGIRVTVSQRGQATSALFSGMNPVSQIALYRTPQPHAHTVTLLCIKPSLGTAGTGGGGSISLWAERGSIQG
jgi:hypothetical protein